MDNISNRWFVKIGQESCKLSNQTVYGQLKPDFMFP